MKICSVEGCGRKYKSNGYCQKHYDQIRHYGQIKKRTTRDPNEIIVEDQICRMFLYDKNSIKISETIFDLKYKNIIEKGKWHLNHFNYVETKWYYNNCQHQINLHNIIIKLSGQEVSDGFIIDHKDGNTLNNLEENLRICTFSQNQYNSKIRKDNKSGYKGVYFDNNHNIWVSQIVTEKIQIYLGSFDDPKDAAKAYNDAAIEYHGEFAVLNKI